MWFYLIKSQFYILHQIRTQNIKFTKKKEIKKFNQRKSHVRMTRIGISF
jgi:hypothetical protein